MKHLLVVVLSAVCSMPVFAWSTRPGWPALPSQKADRIQVALARGSAESPSAVFPLTEPGTPIACWWNERELHLGTNVFEFSKLAVKPVDGAAFSVKLPLSEGWAYAKGMKEIILDIVLDEDAPEFSVPDFGILGNQSIDMPVFITPKKSGQVRVFSNAVGARSPRFIRDKIIKA
jgi:hypothetical protein